QADADLAQVVQLGCVAGRQQRIRQRTKRNAIVKDSGAASKYRVRVTERRPGKPDARREIVAIGVDRLQKLKVVSQPRVDRQPRTHLPLVLSVNPDIGIGLGHLARAKGLGETRVGIRAGKEIRQRRERIGTANRSWKGDAVAVVQKIDPRSKGVATRLVR